MNRRRELEHLQRALTMAGVQINALYNDLSCSVLSQSRRTFDAQIADDFIRNVRGTMLTGSEWDIVDSAKADVNEAGAHIHVMWNKLDALLWLLEDA